MGTGGGFLGAAFGSGLFGTTTTGSAIQQAATQNYNTQWPNLILSMSNYGVTMPRPRNLAVKYEDDVLPPATTGPLAWLDKRVTEMRVRL